MKCAACSIEKSLPVTKTGGERIPKGWKRATDASSAYCSGCWGKKYLLRAITTPVVEPLSGTWPEFREACAKMWRLTTAASNRMMTDLYVGDVRRNVGDDKMPPMPKAYLYPAIRAEFPGLPSQSVAALEQAVQAKYRAKRYHVNWTAGASLPNHRYPTPFAVPNQGWSITFDSGNRPVISARIGDKRWEFRLKGGPRFRRQIAALRQIASGVAKQGELALFRKADGMIMCKAVAWLPRPDGQSAVSGILRVRTAEDALLVAVNEKDERIWTYHASHLLRWQAEHKRKLQAWADDSKFERRPVPAFSKRRDEAVQKHKDRMRSAVQMLAADLIGYAKRRKFAALQYDDSCHEFAGDDFPYFALRDQVTTKADEVGITIMVASGGVVDKTLGPLAEEEVE